MWMLLLQWLELAMAEVVRNRIYIINIYCKATTLQQYTQWERINQINKKKVKQKINKKWTEKENWKTNQIIYTIKQSYIVICVAVA